LTNINDVINKLKIVIQIMAHPAKFSSQSTDFMKLREVRPVPGTLSQNQVASIPTETAEQRNWLQGFVFRAPTSAERAAAMVNSPELRNLQAQSAALQ
jgi:DNA gyrase/topoisomerase IV subunit B